MKQTIRRLYDDLTKNMVKDGISEWERDEIRKLLLEERANADVKLSIDEMTDISFRIAGIGEEAGFVRGFQYAVKLLTECV